MDTFVVICIIVIIYLIYDSSKRSGFEVDRATLYKEIISNKDLFKGQNYDKLKSKMKWIDASIYTSVKGMIAQNTPINESTLSMTL